MDTKTVAAPEVPPMDAVPSVRYAWRNDIKDTWFITKHRRAFMPEGSILLYLLGCVPTFGPIWTASDDIPQVGDVITDVDGTVLQVVTVDWA